MLELLLFAALAQTPDAFTGTWKLNAAKSTFANKDEAYTSGTRSYAPTKNGTRVKWLATGADGKEIRGGYTTICQNGHCISEPVYWKVRDSHTVVGETFTKGVLEHTYTRSVSQDGKTMTITMYLPGRSKPSSVQVWEKQPPK